MSATLVWDLPLRICHWLLVASVMVAMSTGFAGGPWLVWHERSGALLMVLVIFRVIWGFIGSYHGRFASFLPTPDRLRAYWNGRWQGAGHNPLGALSVIALLVGLSLQVGTGLFATDDSDFSGPLYELITRVTSIRLTHWHQQSAFALLGLITLHLLAIAFYWLRGTNLLRPMLTGRKALQTPSASPGRLPAWRPVLAVALACVLAAGVFGFARLRPTPASPVAIADW